MKLQIRRNLFETNSSSTHSLTMCLQKDYEAFMHGEKVYDHWEGKLVDIKDVEDPKDIGSYNDYGCRYLTYEDYMNIEYEDFYEEYTTPSGEVIVAFGYYGADY